MSFLAERMCLDRYIQSTEAKLWAVWMDIHRMMDFSSVTGNAFDMLVCKCVG